VPYFWISIAHLGAVVYYDQISLFFFNVCRISLLLFIEEFLHFPIIAVGFVYIKCVSVIGEVNQSFHCIIRESYSLCAGRMLARR
jgi:hypothetical protein